MPNRAATTWEASQKVHGFFELAQETYNEAPARFLIPWMEFEITSPVERFAKHPAVRQTETVRLPSAAVFRMAQEILKRGGVLKCG